MSQTYYDQPYPYLTGGFDGSIAEESYGNPDVGDNTAVTDPTIQPTDAQQSANYPPLVVQSSVRLAQMARLRLGDVPAAFSCRVTCDGAKWRFELPVEKVDTNQLQVVITDGTTPKLQVLNEDFTADFRNGVLSFNQPPASGLLLIVTGFNYKDFLPGELQMYVRTAFLQHTQGYSPPPKLDVWPIPTPPTYGPNTYGTPPQPQLEEIEEYPLSLLVASLCLWDVAISISQDVDIRTPDGVTISRGQRFNQVMSMIRELDAKYEQLCRVLNIGFWRIQMSTLRRVSFRTNRLVPVFRAQEYDDLSWRQREMPRVDVENRLITDQGNWVQGKFYSKDSIVAQGGVRYISIQDVPAGGPSPETDVNPQTNNGFYWAITAINNQNWYGVWF